MAYRWKHLDNGFYDGFGIIDVCAKMMISWIGNGGFFF